MEKSQYSVRLANYNKNLKTTTENSLDYQIPYKISPLVDCDRSLLKTRAVLEAYDNHSYMESNNNHQSLHSNDRLSCNGPNTLSDNNYVTELNMSIQGESNQFVKTIPITGYQTDRKNTSAMQGKTDIPTVYIIQEGNPNQEVINKVERNKCNVEVGITGKENKSNSEKDIQVIKDNNDFKIKHPLKTNGFRHKNGISVERCTLDIRAKIAAIERGGPSKCNSQQRIIVPNKSLKDKLESEKIILVSDRNQNYHDQEILFSKTDGTDQCTLKTGIPVININKKQRRNVEVIIPLIKPAGRNGANWAKNSLLLKAGAKKSGLETKQPCDSENNNYNTKSYLKTIDTLKLDTNSHLGFKNKSDTVDKESEKGSKNIDSGDLNIHYNSDEEDDDISGGYANCSCCNEEVFIESQDNDLLKSASISSDLNESLVDNNDNYNYLKESRSSDNLSLYSFFTNEEIASENNLENQITDNSGISVLEDSDINGGHSMTVFTCKSQHSLISSKTGLKSSNDSENVNANSPEGDQHRLKGYQIEDDNKTDNLMIKDNPNSALNNKEVTRANSGSVLSSSQQVDYPFKLIERKSGSEMDNNTDIENCCVLNGLNIVEDENCDGNISEIPPDIVTSNCAISNLMAGKAIYNKPDVISVPERAKLFITSRNSDNNDTWKCSNQQKYRQKASTLPAKLNQIVLAEDEEETQAISSISAVLVPNQEIKSGLQNDIGPPFCSKKKRPSISSIDSDDNDKTDLDDLKEMAKRLNLSTRRPSYLLWKERLKTNSNLISSPPENVVDDLPSKSVDDLTSKLDRLNPGGSRLGSDESLTKEESINQALSWLKRELIEMRSQDQALARTLLKLRQEIREFKLQRSCAEHQEILEDAIDLEEEKDILGELSCDYIQESLNPTLKHVGVTRMNIGRRRFSVF